MVYFIGREIFPKETIDVLRNELLNNTRDMVSLFQERMELAGRILKAKEELKMPVRDRKRELKVIQGLGNISADARSFLNLLFELTILAETRESAGESGKYTPELNVCVNGNREALERMCAMILCSPGSEVFSSCTGENTFLLEASLRGAHIIDGECNTYDVKVCIGKTDNSCNISILDSNAMKIPADIFAKRGSIKTVRVVTE